LPPVAADLGRAPTACPIFDDNDLLGFLGYRVRAFFGGSHMKKFFAVFATIALLAAATYAQSLEKAAKRSTLDQQTEASAPEPNG
jgi:hypothetical protein